MCQWYDSGPVGDIQFGRPSSREKTWLEIFLCFGFAVAVLWFWLYILQNWFQLRSFSQLAKYLGFTGLYLVVAYLIRPRPNLENRGLMGGLQDDPWRRSDDINRSLDMMDWVLWPGRFIAESLVDMLVWLVRLGR